MGGLGKLFEVFKKMLNGKDKKRLIENSLIIVIIGVIIIIAGGTFFKGNAKTDGKQRETGGDSTEVLGKTVIDEEKSELENKLASILSKIEGVGKADVMITYISGKEIVPAYETKKNENDTQEKDSNGGSRSIKENSIESSIAYQEEQGGGKKPILIKDLQPVVKGVVVAADGATDPDVKERISKAVQVLMDIPIHKVQVFERDH